MKFSAIASRYFCFPEHLKFCLRKHKRPFRCILIQLFPCVLIQRWTILNFTFFRILFLIYWIFLLKNKNSHTYCHNYPMNIYHTLRKCHLFLLLLGIMPNIFYVTQKIKHLFPHDSYHRLFFSKCVNSTIILIL